MRVLDLGGGFTAGDPAAPDGALGTAVPAAINAALVRQALLGRHPRSQTTILLAHDVEPQYVAGSSGPTLLQPANCVVFHGSMALSRDACRM